MLARAQEEVGKACYKNALNYIYSLARVLRCDAPSKRMPIRANIIMFQIGYWTADKDLAKMAASVSVDQAMINYERTDKSKERYTAAYLYGLCEFAAGRFPEESEFLLSLARRISAVNLEFDPKDVPRQLFSEMPLGSKKVT